MTQLGEIQQAILNGESAAVGSLARARELPRGDRARRRGRHVRGPREPGQGPAQVAARRRRARPGARPGRGAGRRDGERHQLQHRVDVDLRADPHLQVPQEVREALAAGQAARPALPRGRLGPVRRGAAHRRRRAQLEAGRRGRRALPQRRARGPGRAQRHDARHRAADLGLRDELRRARRGRAGQGQPADAEAGPPDLGGSRLPRPGQLHRLPPARLAQRRGHEAGRRRPDLGRFGRPRLLRDAVRAERRRDPGLRRLQPGEGGDLPQARRRADHRPQRRGLQVLEERAPSRTRRSGSASARRSAS